MFVQSGPIQYDGDAAGQQDHAALLKIGAKAV